MSRSPGAPDDAGADWDRIAELLDAWEQANAAGRDVPPEDLCRECPELLPWVEDVIGARRVLAGVWGGAEAAPGSAPADPLRYQPGEVIDGRFRLEREIARGGSAVIWRCRTDGSARMAVAVKLPHSPHPDPDRDITDLFLKEGATARALYHENIVPVYAYGRHGAVAYIAFKLVEGKTLRDRIREADGHPLTPSEVRSIARQMACALGYAHSKEVIHRDLKPENVLLGADGRVFLTDFGIALTLGEVAGGMAGGTGTPAYMAPELEGRDATPASDVYAFGVILYELLTGHRPPGPLRGRGDPALAGVPTEFRPVLLKCLARNPSARYANGDMLLDALHSVAAPLPATVPPSEPPRPPRDGPARGGSPTGVRPWRAATARGASLAFALAAVTLAVLAGTAAVGAGRDVRPVPTVVAVVAACLGIGFAVVRPHRAVLGFVGAAVLGIALAALLGGTADSLL